MLECIKILLSFINEESLECLSKLLSTIGEPLEQTVNLSEQFAAIDNLIANYKSLKISNRIRFMLQDLRDLRNNNWQLRRKAVINPQKLDDIKTECGEDESVKVLDESFKMNANNSVVAETDISDDKRNGIAVVANNNVNDNINTPMRKTYEQSNGILYRMNSYPDNNTPLRKTSLNRNAPQRKISATAIENAATSSTPYRKISNTENNNNSSYRKNSRVEHMNRSRSYNSSLPQIEQSPNVIDVVEQNISAGHHHPQQSNDANNLEPKEEWSTTSSKKKGRQQQQNGNRLERNSSKATV